MEKREGGRQRPGKWCVARACVRRAKGAGVCDGAPLAGGGWEDDSERVRRAARIVPSQFGRGR